MADQFDQFGQEQQDMQQQLDQQAQQFSQQYGQQPYGQYGAPQYGTPAGDGRAKTALILGIVGLVLSFLIPIIGLILGVIAIVMAGKAVKEGYVGGQAKIGRILGIVAIIIAVIMMVVAIAGVAALINSPEFMEMVQQAN